MDLFHIQKMFTGRHSIALFVERFFDEDYGTLLENKFGILKSPQRMEAQKLKQSSQYECWENLQHECNQECIPLDRHARLWIWSSKDTMNTHENSKLFFSYSLYHHPLAQLPKELSDPDDLSFLLLVEEEASGNVHQLILSSRFLHVLKYVVTKLYYGTPPPELMLYYTDKTNCSC